MRTSSPSIKLPAMMISRALLLLGLLVAVAAAGPEGKLQADVPCCTSPAVLRGMHGFRENGGGAHTCYNPRDFDRSHLLKYPPLVPLHTPADCDPAVEALWEQGQVRLRDGGSCRQAAATRATTQNVTHTWPSPFTLAGDRGARGRWSPQNCVRGACRVRRGECEGRRQHSAAGRTDSSRLRLLPSAPPSAAGLL